VARHSADASLLEITYDVVVVGDGKEVLIAREQKAPLRADPGVVEEFERLLSHLGENIELAVGLTDPSQAEEPKHTTEENLDDDQEL
jgi:hypothetical protein